MNFEIKYDDTIDLLSVRLNNNNPVVNSQVIAPNITGGFDFQNTIVTLSIPNPIKNIGSVFSVYRKYFVNTKMYTFNKYLFNFAASGMGILNYENSQISGEQPMIDMVKYFFQIPIIFDIGANVGNYSNLIRSVCPSAKLYAFEPHPVSFEKLSLNAEQHNYSAINEGFGKEPGEFNLFDYANNEGSEHASVFQNVIEGIHQGVSKPIKVKLNTIDLYCSANNINRINFLKVDTEGNEYDVFLGAQDMLAQDKIDIIQFEFNEMNIISRHYLKDFKEILKGYGLFRLLPDGLVELPNEIFSTEIFAYQNIVAVHKTMLPKIYGK